jgi:hypothetical protein
MSLPQTTADQDIQKLAEVSANWANSSFTWISTHITPAAAEKFVQLLPSSLSFTLPGTKLDSSHANMYSNWRLAMPQYVENLDALMRSDEMYPQ